MHKQSRPRTPRYWPRMKVRGARRKRKRTTYLFQRIGDAGRVSTASLNAFAAGLVIAQDSINRMLARQRVIEVGYYGTVTPEMLDMLGESITKEEHGNDS